MPKINVLPKNVAELIAAGEVIERPASIVKELAENSIDAGATKITIEIKDGGITYISVKDDGCGIEKDDLHKAFLRHATSKVITQDDLDNVFTLGFRGEALASICAVADCTLISKTADSENGYSIKAIGGIIEEEELTGCEKGTIFIAKDLFYNTPARMKFLKKDSSEGNAVTSFVEKLAVSNPQIAFKFIKDEKIILNTPGNGDLFATIYAVYGKDFANSLIKAEYIFEGISISGYISKPEKPRGNRMMQNFFINGRYFKSKTVMAALEQGYKNSMMTGRFPACILLIKIAPQLCDCNVHPQKLEVRFANEKPIFHGVYYCVKNTLDNYKANKTAEFSSIKTNIKNSWDLNNQNDEPQLVQKTVFPKGDIPQQKSNNIKQADYVNSINPVNHVKKQDVAATLNFIEKIKEEFKEDNISEEIQNVSQQTKRIEFDYNNFNLTQDKAENNVDSFNCSDVIIEYEEPIQSNDEKVDDNFNIKINNQPEEQSDEKFCCENDIYINFKVIGEVFKTYILVEKDNDLILIDKHAAHERIIFDQLKNSQKPEGQRLFTPVIIKLSSSEFDAIFENLEELEQKAFKIEEFGENTIIVREFPTIIKQGEIENVICEIAGNLINHRFEKNYSKLDWIYHSISCRAAIKANDYTTIKELEELAKQVFTLKNIDFCPHGRPVKITLNKKEIEKMFGRI